MEYIQMGMEDYMEGLKQGKDNMVIEVRGHSPIRGLCRKKGINTGGTSQGVLREMLYISIFFFFFFFFF